MKVEFSDRFTRSFAKAPERVQNKFAKQLDHLLRDLRHPSLHAKKYDEARDVWQGRVDRDWRFYFTIEGDTYYMVDIIPHPK